MPAAADAVAGGFRKRRSIQRGIKVEDGMSRNYVPVFREGALASYSMFRGFLNAMDTSTQDCSALFICEAATQAAKTGKTGYTVAKAARYTRLTICTIAHCFSIVKIRDLVKMAKDEFLSFSDNASKWLMSMDPIVHLKTKKAGKAGARFGRSLQDKSRAPQVLWTNWMDDEDEFCRRR